MEFSTSRVRIAVIRWRDRSSDPRWRDAIAIFTLAGLIILFFWKMTFTPLILPRGDALTYFYPYWQYRNESLLAGRLPMWNPYLFMGAPFLANSQAGVLYPFNWPLVALDAPQAVKVSAILHLVWAAAGAYLFARRAVQLKVTGAFGGAIAFSLGGYLTAQVEHINQLQGLSWLPWIFLAWWAAKDGHVRARYWMGLAFAMQLLAGHSQTAFITGSGLGVWAAWEGVAHWFRRRSNREPDGFWKATQHVVGPLLILAGGVLLATGLAAAQLVPTLALIRLSNRSGGLPFIEALSFSFKPHFVGRGLLPSFQGEALFSEYVAFVGITGLLLASIGAWAQRHRPIVQRLAGLSALGIFLALGAYNPLYWLLVRYAPGFDLFRAPARWLALWAFGAAMLVGIGVERIGRPTNTRARWLVGVILALALLAFAAPLTRDQVPGATAPGVPDIAAWLITLLVGLGLLRLAESGRLLPGHSRAAMMALLIGELFLGSRNLPYNDLSSPQIWVGQRPAISALLAASQDTDPPGRYLSISDTLFDPGDLRELESTYGPHLDEAALYDLVVGAKLKEVLAPNLSMAWGIPAMDGFDGGILPTRDYTEFTSLFLSEEERSPDGRLRENLEHIPDLKWLAMSNVRWIVTDKVFDLWIDGIYYDLQFPYTAAPGDTLPVTAIPPVPLETTTINMIGYVQTDFAIPEGTQIGTVAAFASGEQFPFVQPLVYGRDFVGASADNSIVASKQWETAIRIERVEVTAVEGFPGRLVIRGMSLIDQRTGAFVATTLSKDFEVRLRQSGDVKIYELVDARPRAFLSCNPELVATRDEAGSILGSRTGPGTVIEDPASGKEPSCDPEHPGTVSITYYAPEEVGLDVDVVGDGEYLVLLDAWNPDWQAYAYNEKGERRLNILRANGYFRAVRLRQGDTQVKFVYSPHSLWAGVVITGECILMLFAGLLLRWRPASA